MASMPVSAGLLRLLAPLPLGRWCRCGFGPGRLVLGIQASTIRTQHRTAAPAPLAQLPRLDQRITGRHKLRLGQPGELRLELVLQGLVADAAAILGNGRQHGDGKGLGVEHVLLQRCPNGHGNGALWGGDTGWTGEPVGDQALLMIGNAPGSGRRPVANRLRSVSSMRKVRGSEGR